MGRQHDFILAEICLVAILNLYGDDVIFILNFVKMTPHAISWFFLSN